MNKEAETKETEEIVTPEGDTLRFYSQPSTDITIRIPLTVLASIDRVAAHRDMSREALLRYYIGHELRMDLAKFNMQEPFKTREQRIAESLQAEESAAAA